MPYIYYYEREISRQPWYYLSYEVFQTREEAEEALDFALKQQQSEIDVIILLGKIIELYMSPVVYETKPKDELDDILLKAFLDENESSKPRSPDTAETSTPASLSATTVNYLWIGTPTIHSLNSASSSSSSSTTTLTSLAAGAAAAASTAQVIPDMTEKTVGGHDTHGPIAMATLNKHSTIIFWCLHIHKDYYENIFHEHNIKVQSIEAYLLAKLFPDKTFEQALKEVELPDYHYLETEDNAKFVYENIKNLLNNPERNSLRKQGTDQRRDQVSIKNLVSLFLLLEEAGYVMDTNVWPKEQLLQPIQRYDQIRVPYIGNVSPECWLMYSPQPKNALAIKIFADYLLLWKEAQELFNEKPYSQDYYESQGHIIIQSLIKNYDATKMGYWRSFLNWNEVYISELGLMKYYYNTHKSQTDRIKNLLLKQNELGMNYFFENSTLADSVEDSLKLHQSEVLMNTILEYADQHDHMIFFNTNNPFIWAVFNDDVAQMANILGKAHCPIRLINQRFKSEDEIVRGETPLHIAIHLAKHHAVEYLLNLPGIDINAVAVYKNSKVKYMTALQLLYARMKEEPSSDLSYCLQHFNMYYQRNKMYFSHIKFLADIENNNLSEHSLNVILYGDTIFKKHFYRDCNTLKFIKMIYDQNDPVFIHETLQIIVKIFADAKKVKFLPGQEEIVDHLLFLFSNFPQNYYTQPDQSFDSVLDFFASLPSSLYEKINHNESERHARLQELIAKILNHKKSMELNANIHQTGQVTNQGIFAKPQKLDEGSKDESQPQSPSPKK